MRLTIASDSWRTGMGKHLRIETEFTGVGPQPRDFAQTCPRYSWD